LEAHQIRVPILPDEGTAGDYPTCVACRDAQTSPSLTNFMRKLLEDTAQRAISYLESLEARSVAPLPVAVAQLSTLDEPCSAPTPPEHVIKQLDETCSPATTAMAGSLAVIGGLSLSPCANCLPPGTRIRPIR
jgi:hypothetical protein